MKLGIECGGVASMSEAETLSLIKEAGFEAVFSCQYDLKTVDALKNECEKLGLSLDFLHAPYAVNRPFRVHINDFWRSDLTYLPLWDAIRQSIDAAQACGIGTVVEHISGDWTAPPITDTGLSRFDALVSYALERNVRLAFENLRNLGNLAVLLERYESFPQVGFCYDCGHEHCYTGHIPMMTLFGSRCFCTHLHDNFGRDPQHPKRDTDAHLLPFDGTIDYTAVMASLRQSGYTGTLMLEVSYENRQPIYEALTPRRYFALAYERLSRLAKL